KRRRDPRSGADDVHRPEPRPPQGPRQSRYLQSLPVPQALLRRGHHRARRRGVPHRGHRLRRRQEAPRRDHDREAAADARAARGARPRSDDRLGRAARRQPQGPRPRRGDDGAGARGDEDLVRGAAMSEQETQPGLPLAEEENEDAYNVTLPSFHGPLDLLLYLIKQSKIDIYDIPILLITEQYTAYLDAMEELDLEVAADYIYMAALLINIKSRMLLPHDESDV